MSSSNPAISDNDKSIYSKGIFEVTVGPSADKEMDGAFVYKIVDTIHDVVQMETTVLLNAYHSVSQLVEQLDEFHSNEEAEEKIADANDALEAIEDNNNKDEDGNTLH